MVLQLLAEFLSAPEFELVLLQELEHVIHVRRGLAVDTEQALAAVALIKSREGFVNAQRKGLTVVAAEKYKGITAHERWNIFGLPAALSCDIHILVGTDAENSGRQNHVAGTTKDDGVFQCCTGKLCSHEG